MNSYELQHHDFVSTLRMHEDLSYQELWSRVTRWVYPYRQLFRSFWKLSFWKILLGEVTWIYD